MKRCAWPTTRSKMKSMAERTGVNIGSGIGGFDIIEREHSNLLNGGPRKISPFFIPAAIVNLAAGQVSIRHNAKGPNEATCTACTTSAHSIGDAARVIKYGDADVMIAGGTEAAITPMGVGGFAAMRALSTRNDDPHRASRPWDKDRDGFVIGEGSGILILEELEFATQARREDHRRGRRLRHERRRQSHHPARARRRRRLSRDAQCHARCRTFSRSRSATSTPMAPRLRWATNWKPPPIKRAFGDHAYKMLVSSTKSMTGHLLGGAGGLEAAITVLALRDQIVPPTMNLDNPERGLRSRLRSPTPRARSAWITPCRTRSASAEPTAAWCSSAGRSEERPLSVASVGYPRHQRRPAALNAELSQLSGGSTDLTDVRLEPLRNARPRAESRRQSLLVKSDHDCHAACSK